MPPPYSEDLRWPVIWFQLFSGHSEACFYPAHNSGQGLCYTKEGMRSNNWNSTPRDQTTWTGSSSINWLKIPGVTWKPSHETSLLPRQHLHAASLSATANTAITAEAILDGWWSLELTCTVTMVEILSYTEKWPAARTGGITGSITTQRKYLHTA